jgi:hypothetical protein
MYRRSLAALVAILLGAVVLAIGARPATALAADPGAADTYAGLLNDTRAQFGLGPAARDAGLDRVAQQWANNIASGGCGGPTTLCHRPDLLQAGQAVEPALTWIGENVGWSTINGSAAATMAGLQQGFMNSPGHRANILKPEVNRVGVGVATDSGRVYIAVNFVVGPNIAPTAQASLDLRASGFQPITPVRLVDTRVGARVPPASIVRVHVGGQAGIPSDASAVALNVTITEAGGDGYVTVYPCDTPRPNASSLNHRPGETRANFVVTALGNGDACIYTQTGGHFLADAAGWFRADIGTGYRAERPSRLLDTRTTGAPIQNAVVTVPGAVAAVANVTVTQPAGAGYLTAWPCGVARPQASNLNFTPGDTVANLVAVALPANGQLCLYTSVPAHVIVDLQGRFGPDTARLQPMAPVRLLDTRGGAPLTGGGATALVVPVRGRNGVPNGARSAVLNVTVTQPSAAGWLSVYPCDEGMPTASNVNYAAGQTVPNAVIAKLDGQGRVCIASWATTHVIADIDGWLG